MKKSTLYPDEWIRSTNRIDFEALYREGYRGLIFDIDNTLVPHGAPADERAIYLFQKLRKIGFQICLLSNNRKARVEPFQKQVGPVQAIWMANKPFLKGYRQAMELLGTDSSNTVFIGDQIFTDVWGASRLGIHTILVGQIAPREEIQIVLKRLLEKPVLNSYKRSPFYKDHARHELPKASKDSGSASGIADAGGHVAGRPDSSSPVSDNTYASGTSSGGNNNGSTGSGARSSGSHGS